jgi:predicted MPP superfamily phosphohydrolase
MWGLLIVALCCWCASRWNVWFENPEEDAYEPSDVPARILLSFGDEDGECNRNISWTCGTEVKESFVELSTLNCQLSTVNCQLSPAIGEVFASRHGKAAYYVARLRDLKAGHTYRYRVCTGGKKSDWHEFHLPQAHESETTFLYMGDIQDSIGGIANHLLREAFRRNPDTEFLVCGGDLTERPTDAYWGETFETLDSVGQSVPVLTITGNHDYLKGIVCQLERRFSLIHSYFLDSMVGENQVFTVRYKNVQLFCLDSNREFFYLWTQRRWLEEQLEKSRAKWKIVVLHHPLYSIRSSMNNLIQRWMFNDIICEHEVDVVLQGHEHAYARMTTNPQPSTLNSKPSTPIYTVSHCSPKSYRIEFDEMVDKFGTGSRYYQMVRTRGVTIVLTAWDANEGTLYDSLYIVKRGANTQVVDAGKDIPEKLTFTPDPHNKKDVAFAERIKAYKRRKHL